MKSSSESYKNAGVDITAGYKAVELMKKHVERTKTNEVFSELGGFGGMILPSLAGINNPVLVSGTDGVGTKLKIAYAMDKHDTVGIDLVAMSVNDVICCGARPMFFLDYIAIGKNIPEKVAMIVKGIADGCVMSAAALVGGETAEMPGIYDEDEYDLAGFAVGIVDKDKIIDNKKIADGDIIIALSSSGVHSNGFSLTRKVFKTDKNSLDTYVPELSKTLGEELLVPTKIYVKPVLAALNCAEIKGISHITGGGFYENIPRCLPAGMYAHIEKNAVRIPPVFDLIKKEGNIPEKDMFNTYNMGVGMCLVTAKENADRVLTVLRENGEDAYVIGGVRTGGDGVILA